MAVLRVRKQRANERHARHTGLTAAALTAIQKLIALRLSSIS